MSSVCKEAVMFCAECNENLTIHADGTVTCACELQRTGDPIIPASWKHPNGEDVDAHNLTQWREYVQH